jgi:hypothetical protein
MYEALGSIPTITKKGGERGEKKEEMEGGKEGGWKEGWPINVSCY